MDHDRLRLRANMTVKERVKKELYIYGDKLRERQTKRATTSRVRVMARACMCTMTTHMSYCLDSVSMMESVHAERRQQLWNVIYG